MKLCELLDENHIIPQLQNRSKEGVIDELINLFQDDPRIIDLSKAKTIVLGREKIMSTGVGKNFAIPHGKTDAVKDIICAFGRSTIPIDFNSLDGQPVFLVVLLIGTDEMVNTHIKLLSRISRMMTKDDFRESLLKAETTKEIINVFIKEEESYFDL